MKECVKEGMFLEQVRQHVELTDANQQIALFGVENKHVKFLESEYQVVVTSRGERIDVVGSREAVDKVIALLEQYIWLIKKGQSFSMSDVMTGIKLLAKNRLDMFRQLYDDEVGKTIKGDVIRAKNFGQRQYVRAIKQSDIIFGVGPAGTGKTFLAVVMAVNALKNGDVKRIVLTRPAVEAGENLGFLPGDLKEKVDPYLRPVYDALHAVLGQDHTTRLLDRGVIEIAPLAYMRGRTLDDAFVILDEAQNTTVAQMKMFLTRLGFGSKMIVNGDVSQIDLGKGVKSGLVDAQQKLQHIDKIRFVTFDAYDVVRHALVSEIIQAYSMYKQDKKEERDENNHAEDSKTI